MGEFFSATPSKFSLDQLNAPGSDFAANYSLDVNKTIKQLFRQAIIDAAPQDYDMKMIFMKQPKQVSSDETIWFEKPFEKVRIVSTVLAANIAAASTQTITIINPTAISAGVEVKYDATNTTAIVDSVDPVAGTMTVSALTGQTLPALTISTTYTFTHGASVDADGTTGITPGYRLSGLPEFYNYVQLFARKIPYGRYELEKQKNNEVVDYLASQHQSFLRLMRTDMTQSLFNGKKGRGIVQGQPAKLMQGVYPEMVERGCTNVSTTPSNILAALKIAGFQSRLGSGNYVRYFVATPKWCDALADATKQPLQRWTGSGEGATAADLQLDYVSVGTSKYVLVPVQSLESNSAMFPGFFENLCFVLDIDTIQPVEWMGFRQGYVGHRGENPYTTANRSEEYIEYTMSCEYHKMLGDALLTITP